LNEFAFDLAIAPLLAIHGTIILFVKNKTKATVRYSFALILLGIAKLALIDTANAVLWQKVMLFIGIGVFILLASFWYQKLVSKDAEALVAEG
ncbi:MAG: putative membrane protein, partial [Pseudomonadales bacterium]